MSALYDAADLPVDRVPYIGIGAQGARLSALIDMEEADDLPPGPDRDRRLISAEAWQMQADRLELGKLHHPVCPCRFNRLATCIGCAA